MPENNNTTYQPMSFDKIKIGLASPEKIREWAHRTPEPEDKNSDAWESGTWKAWLLSLKQ